MLTDGAKAYTVPRNFRGAAGGGVELLHTGRFVQILQDKWRMLAPPFQRRAAARTPRWLDRYNHRRPHCSAGGAVDASHL